VFANDIHTGIFSSEPGNFSIACDGPTTLSIDPLGTVAIKQLKTNGIVHNNTLGELSTSLIVNNDVATGAAISDTKLATISTTGKVSNSATTATNLNTTGAIVARDASGNFYANTINATNVIFATGSAASPSVTFNGSTGSGIYSSDTNKINIVSQGYNLINFDNPGGTTPSVTIPTDSNLIINGNTTFNNPAVINNAATFNNTAITFNSTTNFNGQNNLIGTNNLSGTTNISGTTTLSGTTNITTAINLSAGGTQTSPTITFNNNLNTGIYSQADNNVSISASGAEILNISTNGINLKNSSITFNGNTGSGIYSPDTDQIAISAQGQKALFSSEGVTIPSGSRLKLPSGGDSNNPSLYWATGIGIYSPSQDSLNITINGTSSIILATNVISTPPAALLDVEGTLQVDTALNAYCPSTFTYPATFSAGTLSSPAIKFSGSATNTGIYTSAANKIDIGVSGLNLMTLEYPTVSIPSDVGFVANGTSSFKKPVVFDASVAFNGKENVQASSYDGSFGSYYSIPANVNVIALTGLSSNFYVSTLDPYEMQMGKIVTFIAAGPGDYTIRSRNDSTEGSIILNPISLPYGHAIQFIYAGTLGSYPYALVKLNG
jgi:hypothetical protein